MSSRTSSQSFSAVGGEVQVNTETDDNQLFPSMTALNGGGFVVTWQSYQDGNPIRVYGQRYDVTGATDGAEFLINTTTDISQSLPSVTALNDGGFVVTWESAYRGAAVSGGAGWGIYGRRYDASGVPDGGEFQINTAIDAAQGRPSVTVLNDGGFVVAWEAYFYDGSGFGIYGRRYDVSGAPDDSEFLINTTTAGNQQLPSVTALNDGDFVVTWQSADQDGDGFGIYGQRYDASGAPDGGEFLINTTTASNQQNPSVIALNNGGFVVAWTSGDGSASGVYGQRYDVSGTLEGGEFLINTTTANNQQNPSGTALSDGGFVVTWMSRGQDGDGGGIYGNGWGIYGQRYNASGVPEGGELLINTTTDGYQESPSVALLNDGDIVVSWQSHGQDGDRWGIFSQRFDANSISTGDVTLAGIAIEGEVLTAETATIADADGLGVFLYNWLHDGGVISGANAATYTLTDADVGAAITAQVSYEDASGIVETLTSDPTSLVESWDLTLVGTPDDDVLTGKNGNDTITGLGGNDRLVGNGGDDSLAGGDGADTLNGGDGNDTIAGGETEADLRDVIYAGAGHDSVDGGYGNDLIFGMEGNDTLAGGFGVDELQGLDGDDVITGSAFSDLVYGGAGDDFVNGGFGHDRINGGPGADKFYHVGVLGHGSDWVQDYSTTEGDVLLFGITTASRDDFQVNFSNTEDAGDADVNEAFVIYKPTEQIMWALIDGEGQTSINLKIGGDTFDLLA